MESNEMASLHYISNIPFRVKKKLINTRFR